MTLPTIDAFDLPPNLAAKADPALIGADERHFSAIADTLARRVAELSARLDAARLASDARGQAAVERDLEVRRLASELRLLRRFGLDLCLGRMVPAGDPEAEPTYVGRTGLRDADGRRLLVDWRAPAAEPFFGATHADPMGLASRRRYRWSRGRVRDYWDEVFTPEGLAGHAALDDQSAFIASLGGARSPRMRDVLGTIQADQDAIIRAGSRGALVVDGGPGTGKTVVALHRAAYLLHTEPRITDGGGGVLVVGPHEPYLAYVADVLPSLGEESVHLCILRDLVPGGAAFPAEADAGVARLKASAALVDAIEPATRWYERPPTQSLRVETPWADVVLDPADWAEAFGAAEPGTPHNESRADVWAALVEILEERVAADAEEEAPPHLVRRALLQHAALDAAFTRAWPVLDPVGVVGDLWSVPAYLRMCAPGLDDADVRRLQRAEPRAWTASDLPLLDAARRRIGDPEASRMRRRREAALEARREQMARVVDDLISGDDDGEGLVTILRGEDAQHSLVDEAALPTPDPDLLAGPFAHVIVDEAQELTDAEWTMLVRRCPSRSFTIVGDRAQARHGFAETWRERLARVGFSDVALAALTINYRTPQEVMAAAEPAIRAALPDANVPTSIRRSGVPVRRGRRSERDAVLEAWLAEHDEGVACVIGDPGFSGLPRVLSLSPENAKGLEFDLVVLVDPTAFGPGIEGAVDRYVAMTRSTRELVVLADE